MPQLMPLLWVCSSIMVIFLVMVSLVLYYIKMDGLGKLWISGVDLKYKMMW